MNKEIFRILKEINSLDKKIQHIKEEIKQENKRIELLQARLMSTEQEHISTKAQLVETNQILKGEEAELERWQSQWEQTQDKLQMASSDKELKSLETQASSIKDHIDRLTDSVFARLETHESLEAELTVLEKFITGAPRGIQEISEDVDINNRPREQKIQSYQERVTRLLSLLPPATEEKFKPLLQLPKSAVTQLDDKNYCGFCGSQISAQRVRNIESQMSLASCPGCSRIIIPLSSQYS